MTRTQKLIDDVVCTLRSLRGHGFTPAVSIEGKNIRVHWLAPGCPCTLYFPVEPDDQHVRAVLRRILRANGTPGGAP
jgi:hypothetical protein